MANGILVFKLPDERYEHKCAINALDAQCEIGYIDEWLRRLLKHGEIEKFTATELAEEIRQRLFEIKIEEE